MKEITQKELGEMWAEVDEGRFKIVEETLSRMYDRGKFDGKNGSCLKDSVVEEAELIMRLF